MKTLDTWKSKKSWKLTMPFCPIYKSMTGEMDILLSRLCGMEHVLTLNADCEFEEITIVDPKEEMEADYLYLVEPLKKEDEWSESCIANILLDRIEKYILELWDGNKFHLVLVSGGVDSRVIVYILAGLRDKLGGEWLGEICFYCLKPEDKIFEKLMQKLGWKKHQYHVHKENQEVNGDYFDYGNFHYNVNSFNPPAMSTSVNFDFYPERRGSECVLVVGTFGGEVLDYPIRKSGNRCWTENRYEDLVKHHGLAVIELISGMYATFEDVLMPYLAYEYLDVAFRIPEKHYRFITRKGQSIAVIRSKMLDLLGDDIEFYEGHGEFIKQLCKRLNISESRRKYIEDRYLGSDFFRDFQFKSFVKEARPWLEPWGSKDSKLYSCAIVYSQIANKEKIEKR